MPRRPAARLLAFLMLPLLLTGCWDRRELEEVAFVLMLGVDKGKESRFNVTAAIAVPSRMAGAGEGSGGGSGGQPPYMLTSVEGPTILGALSEIGGYVDRQLSLDHTMAMFMGEELAREGALQAMDSVVRSRQTRRSMFFIVTKEKAADFLRKMNPELESNPQRFLDKISTNYRFTGLVPEQGQVQSFISQVNTGYSSPVTYYAALKPEPGQGQEQSGQEISLSGHGLRAGELPRTGGPNLEILGAAAFRNDKMVGVLTGQENRMVLMLHNRFQRGYFTVPDPRDPNYQITLDVRKGRPVVLRADLSGSRPRITGEIRLEGEVVSMPSVHDYTEPELHGELERAFSDRLEQNLAELIRKAQEWETDIFGFGHQAARHFPTVASWREFDWPKHYPEAEVDISVKLTLRRFGLQLSPPTTHTGEIAK